jgi:hypothetical protein
MSLEAVFLKLMKVRCLLLSRTLNTLENRRIGSKLYRALSSKTMLWTHP